MARADIYTLLSPDMYAKIMNLNPLHFNGGRLPDVAAGRAEPFTTTNATDWSQRPIWHQYAWQDTPNLSRDQLARVIQQAEKDIAGFLGYWPAPMWTSQEVHMYPRGNRPEYYGSGVNVRSQLKAIKTNYAKIIAVGQRKADWIANASLADGTLLYHDPDIDGWNTQAVIVVPTDVTNECEIKLFFADHYGDPLWEIRPFRDIYIADGYVTIVVDSWLMFDPDVVNAIPTGEVTAINASDEDNYVTAVEVRREYNDITEPQVTFFWEREPGGNLWPAPSYCPLCAGIGCEACSLITQDGCLAIRDAEAGIVAPAPANYDADNARWEKTAWTEGREPDQLKIWYKSGLLSERSLQGYCDTLDSGMARLIAILATSRLGFQFKAQSGLSSMIDHWQRDQAESFPNGSTIFTPPDILSNPFGTRRGEVEVYRALFHMTERKMKVSAVAT